MFGQLAAVGILGGFAKYPAVALMKCHHVKSKKITCEYKIAEHGVEAFAGLSMISHLNPKSKFRNPKSYRSVTLVCTLFT